MTVRTRLLTFFEAEDDVVLMGEIAISFLALSVTLKPGEEGVVEQSAGTTRQSNVTTVQFIHRRLTFHLIIFIFTAQLIIAFPLDYWHKTIVNESKTFPLSQPLVSHFNGLLISHRLSLYVSRLWAYLVIPGVISFKFYKEAVPPWEYVRLH